MRTGRHKANSGLVLHATQRRDLVRTDAAVAPSLHPISCYPRGRQAVC